MTPTLNSPPLAALGNRVREARTENKLTQEQLAALCGFDRTYISLVERGKRNISFTNLIILAKGLDVAVSELVEGIKWHSIQQTPNTRSK